MRMTELTAAIIRGLARGRRLNIHWKIERALADLERNGFVELFPIPHLTEAGRALAATL